MSEVFLKHYMCRLAATLCHFKDYFESHFDYAQPLNNRGGRGTVLQID